MFNFIMYDLESLETGQVVKVDLTTAANVKLLNYDNFTSYRKGGRYRFYGGFTNQTPYQIEVPYESNWILVVDLREPYTANGYIQVNKVSITTVNQQTMDISPAEKASAEEDIESYDIFLSHATEDKDSIARPLKSELEKLGLSVWFDESESTDSSTDGLRKAIDSGIYNSKYAVIVLSPDYMRKPWTNREFEGITSMEMASKQKVLCIWHNITHEEVLQYSPSLVNKLARETIKYSAQEIAQAFYAIVKEPNE